jgi:hypothetical protein
MLAAAGVVPLLKPAAEIPLREQAPGADGT